MATRRHSRRRSKRSPSHSKHMRRSRRHSVRKSRRARSHRRTSRRHSARKQRRSRRHSRRHSGRKQRKSRRNSRRRSRVHKSRRRSRFSSDGFRQHIEDHKVAYGAGAGAAAAAGGAYGVSRFYKAGQERAKAAEAGEGLAEPASWGERVADGTYRTFEGPVESVKKGYRVARERVSGAGESVAAKLGRRPSGGDLGGASGEGAAQMAMTSSTPHTEGRELSPTRYAEGRELEHVQSGEYPHRLTRDQAADMNELAGRQGELADGTMGRGDQLFMEEFNKQPVAEGTEAAFKAAKGLAMERLEAGGA